MMHDAANDTHQLRQAVSLSCLGAEGIGAFKSIACKRRSFGFDAGGLASFYLGDISKAFPHPALSQRSVPSHAGSDSPGVSRSGGAPDPKSLIHPR